MFDQKNNFSSQPAPSASSSSAPPLRQNQPVVEDMFAQTESAAAPSISPRPNQMPRSENGGQSIAGAETELFGGRSFWSNKLLILEIAALVVALIIGGWWLIKVFASSSATNSPAAQNTASNENSDNTQNQNNTAIPVSTENNATTGETVAPKDSDSDGISDEEEKKLNTDPYNADTDSDGLTDRAEIKLYGTDPLNPDTDGDGYKDGEEVINKYDPTKGGGARIRTVPAQ